jgi:hypothetical protein
MEDTPKVLRGGSLRVGMLVWRNNDRPLRQDEERCDRVRWLFTCSLVKCLASLSEVDGSAHLDVCKDFEPP